ncbi:glycosyltransferase family 117 protein [Flavitalea flava]
MSFNRVNNIVGWIVGVIACTVYVMTMEATGSFWDCGEFISSCYKLQIPHPPGAPLFVLIGRFFIILFGDNPLTAARGVNFMSAIASGMSILFLFWSITHFARKIVQKSSLPAGSPTKGSLDPNGTYSLAALTSQQIFTIMSAGVVGALAYTFCDSFWYSAVEGEVYASSAFFTALVFWAALKWEHNADQPGSDKWIIFIFYVMGLSIGVHLLNLLTIPAIVMVYYFKRYKPTLWGTIIAFVIGCGITGVVQKFVIQYTIKGAGAFDIFFVNSLNMPFFVGFAVFFVLLTIALVFAIRWAVRKQYYYLKLGLWCSCFMLLGYSTYFTTIIRSNADPAVDMYNVDNPVSLMGYLSRDQYGDWPIVYGPDFQDQAPRVKTGNLYVRGKEKYEVAGKTTGQDWGNTPSSHLFPRMWDGGNDRNQVDAYKQFSGMNEGDAPSMADNIKYLMRYQVGWMYLRYFMWNFSGKQNDLQGFGNLRDGNWITGISFIDNTLYGDQSKLPDSIHTNNKSYNRMYLLPFILGLIGLVFQYTRNRRDFMVTGLLFFFTGFAIVVYLNQAGYQPRERDYAYAGSFYAFAIWIGLGVIWVKEQLEKVIKGPAANYAAAGLCFLAVPMLMGNQEWDDHDRSKKTLARDIGKDYLESCPPNAILISFGDNDTYPLWYAQEVEGIRPDVRVMNYSLLGTDWYINQLRYKVNKSPAADVIFTPEQIQGSSREVIGIGNMPGFDQNKYYDLFDMMKNIVGSDDPKYTNQSEDGDTYNFLPVRKLSVPVDARVVRANGTVNPGDSVVSSLQLEISKNKNYLFKNELAVLALIAANKWERPICFNSTYELEDLGLAKYIRQDGLAGRLVPVIDGGSAYGSYNNDLAYSNIMTKFAYGNANTPGVYYDEENRRHLNTIRAAHAQLALSLTDGGKNDSARNILEHFDKNVLESNFPYGMTSNRGNQHNRISMSFLLGCYRSGDQALAKKVAASLKKDLQQQLRYYKGLGESMPDEQLAVNAQMIMQGKGGNLSDRQVGFVQDIISSYQMLLNLADWEKQYGQAGAALPQPGSSEKNPTMLSNGAAPAKGGKAPKSDTP